MLRVAYQVNSRRNRWLREIGTNPGDCAAQTGEERGNWKSCPLQDYSHTEVLCFWALFLQVNE
jgi:hypothetical protein